MKIRNMFNRLSKRSKILTSIAAGLVVIAVPAAVYAGYGPNGADRVIYDFSNPAQREGAFDAPRFNSYINTNVYGDERAFLDAKECVVNGADCYKDGIAGGYKDQQPVNVDKEYIVRAYVHNIANPSINDNPATPGANDGIGVAKNTRIRFELPDTEGVANGFTAQARISADNAIPTMVYDTVDLRNDSEQFNVSYVPGSAYIFNASHTDGLQLGDEIMGQTGTMLGDDVMNGIYPGCFEFSAFVVIRVKVTAPELQIEKFAAKVEMPTMNDTAESVSVKRGENVSWRINYKNSGTLFADEVIVRDELPKGLDLVPGSIKLTTAVGTDSIPDEAISAGSGGFNVGDYTPEGNGVVRFTTKVVADKDVCELTNVAFVKAGNVRGERSDTAKVVIEDCEEPKTPIYACTDLVFSRVKGNTFKFTASATAKNGAAVKMYSFNFGDNTTVLVTDKATVEHTYAKVDKYVASTDVTFNVNGQLATDAKNPACVVTVTYDTPTTTTIPNTGAGSTIAIIVTAVAAIGAFAHRAFTLKRQ
jgi:uncharacterized repeat protein (TIGR01451 family)